MKRNVKLKLHLVITDPNDFLREKYDWCFKLRTSESLEWCLEDGHIDTGLIDINVNVDESEMIAKVVQAIDNQLEKEREEFTARINILNGRKQDMLALTGPAPAAEQSGDSDKSPPGEPES